MVGMQVMKCPECGTQNAVRRDFCWSCGADLWPQLRPKRLRDAPMAPDEDDEPAPLASFMEAAARFLRRLFGAGPGSRRERYWS